MSFISYIKLFFIIFASILLLKIQWFFNLDFLFFIILITTTLFCFFVCFLFLYLGQNLGQNIKNLLSPLLRNKYALLSILYLSGLSFLLFSNLSYEKFKKAQAPLFWYNNEVDSPNYEQIIYASASIKGILNDNNYIARIQKVSFYDKKKQKIQWMTYPKYKNFLIHLNIYSFKLQENCKIIFKAFGRAVPISLEKKNNFYTRYLRSKQLQSSLRLSKNIIY